MASWIEFLGRSSKSFVITLGVVLVGMCWLFDVITGSEMATEIFYLIPIAMVTWMAGQWQGYSMCVLGAVAWFVADAMTSPSYSHPAIPYWNALVRLAGFLLVSGVLGAVRRARDQEEEITSFIVHDLRSPLTSVIYGLATLERSAAERADDQDRRRIQACTNSCKRMLQLINALLDLARIEHSKMPVNPMAISARQLIDSSSKEIAMWAEEKQVSLVSQIDAAPKDVLADHALTVRVLVNLLGNAIQHSPSGSTVTVRAAPADADMIAFTVSDQGAGIPKEWTEKVFSKFGQIGARKAGGAVGSGLGLAFCRRAVQAHGGRIWIDSEVDRGTTVTFTLPAAGARS